MCNLFAGYSITKNKNFNRISLEDPEKPAAKQRWTTLRMSKPLVCRQSFAGHVVRSRQKKRNKNLQRMITDLTLTTLSSTLRWVRGRPFDFS